MDTYALVVPKTILHTLVVSKGPYKNKPLASVAKIHLKRACGTGAGGHDSNESIDYCYN